MMSREHNLDNHPPTNPNICYLMDFKGITGVGNHKRGSIAVVIEIQYLVRCW